MNYVVLWESPGAVSIEPQGNPRDPELSPLYSNFTIIIQIYYNKLEKGKNFVRRTKEIR